MQIKLNKKELTEVYNIVNNAKSPIINKLWNSVFGKTPHELITVDYENSDTIIDVDEEIATQILAELAKQSFSISTTFTSTSNPFSIFASLKSIKENLSIKLTRILNDY